MCLSNCPTGYIANSGICELIGSLTLFNFTSGLSLPFNAKSIDVFHHPQGLEFRDQSRLSPIMTKDRGLYFANSSQLVSNTSWILAPDFTICFGLRIISKGIIFQVSGNGQTFLKVYGDDSSFSSEVLLYTTFGNKTETISNIHNNRWFSACLTGYQQKSGYTLNINGKSVVLSNYEFRSQGFDLVFSFGGAYGTSFVGFLYDGY